MKNGEKRLLTFLEDAKHFLTCFRNKSPVKSNILLCQDSARDVFFLSSFSKAFCKRFFPLFINSISIRHKKCDSILKQNFKGW